MARSYWLDLFTGTTWKEFLAAGGGVTGFRERRWKTVQQMKPGDYLLCYLTGISRWIGVLEVVSEAFKDTTPIWKDEAFPARVRVRPVATLSPETAVPVFELRDELSVFRDLKNPNAWTGHFRGSPARWKPADGQAVVAAILDANDNPITRTSRCRQAGPASPSAQGLDWASHHPRQRGTPPKSPSQHHKRRIVRAKEPTAHTEIQWNLLKLGNDMGLDVWVARNDRSRDWKGHRFTDLPRLRSDLPLQFDEATNRTIELIDVPVAQGQCGGGGLRDREHDLDLLGAVAHVGPDRHAAQPQHPAVSCRSR